MGEGEGLLFGRTEGDERVGFGGEQRKKRGSDTLREQMEMYKGEEVALVAYWE